MQTSCATASLFGHQETYTVVFMYPLIIHTRKQMGLIKQLFFFCKSLTIHHFNVQTATAKNKEQDTLSNIISIHFQNCEFFL